MVSTLERIAKFNSKASSREKLIRLLQYASKFVSSVLHAYHSSYAKGGKELLEWFYRFKELEKYFISTRRLVNFGTCTDQFLSAFKSMKIHDPVIRSTLVTAEISLCFQKFCDHVLWLQTVGILKVDKQQWLDRMNKFLCYSAMASLLRDIYETICIIQERRSLEKNDQTLKKLSLKRPLKWMQAYPQVSLDLIKNSCDLLIPCSSMNKVKLHPGLIALVGIVSSSIGLLQIYDDKYKLSID